MQAENDEHYLKEEPHVAFTGEEGFGRYLDLHALYTTFINSKFGDKKLEYFEYVTGLGAHLSKVAKIFKTGSSYK